MKRFFTKMLALTALVLLGAGNVSAEDVYIYFGAKNTLYSSATAAASGDISAAAATNTVAAVTNNKPAGVTADIYRTGSISSFAITLNSIAAKDIVFWGISSGSSKRNLTKVEIDNADVTSQVSIDGAITDNKACYGVTVGNVDMEKGSIIKFTFDGNAQLYYLQVTPMPSDPVISSFKIEGVEATIDQEAKTITAQVSSTMDLSALTAPNVVLGGTAKSYSPVAQTDFSSPVQYDIYASTDGSGTSLKTYTVTITKATSLSNDATLSDLQVDETTLTDFAAEKTAYTVDIPYLYVGYPVVAATKNNIGANITTLTQASEANDGVATIIVTAEDGLTTETYTVTFNRLDAEKELAKLVFSNGFDAFIKGENVTVYYLVGEEIPTLQSYEASTGASVALSEDKTKVIVTGADNTTRELTLTSTEVTPYAPAKTETITFDGTETWIKSGSAYDTKSNKGWVFSKSTEDSDNKRISEGKNRIYFFVDACEKLTFHTASGVSSSRAVKVYVNGEEKLSATAPKYSADGASFDFDLNATSPSMVAVVSNQTGGDGGLGALEFTIKNPTVGISNPSINNISFNGQIISNPEKAALEVFDTTGRIIIRSSEDIDMSAMKGVFVVKSAQGAMKIAVTK